MKCMMGKSPSFNTTWAMVSVTTEPYNEVALHQALIRNDSPKITYEFRIALEKRRFIRFYYAVQMRCVRITDLPT